MLFWRKVDVADNERVLVFDRERLISVLEPGEHKLLTLGKRIRIETYDITKLFFEHAKRKFLLKQYANVLAPYLDIVKLSEQEVGVLYRDGKLSDVLVPGHELITWKGVEDVHVEVFDIAEDFKVPSELVGLLGRGLKVASSRFSVSTIHYLEVPSEHVALLNVNGKHAGLLETGSYAFWKYNRNISTKLLDLRLQSMDVSGQEILTKDRVSLRINLAASYVIVDPEVVALKLKDYASFLYLELQLRLREAVGTKQLDELLENKDALNVDIANGVKDRLAEYGVKLVSVGVKDIILPGDMKVILNQVVEAQKEAEANVIKRREETQAMRSLHNTAKVMENNPVLLRLKELEALERITAKINNISVYGGLDGVLNNLVNISPNKK